jgi:hypothetical protein
MAIHGELIHGLTLLGAILATLGYVVIVRNRKDRRRQTTQAAQTGLQGLVRVMVSRYNPE